MHAFLAKIRPFPTAWVAAAWGVLAAACASSDSGPSPSGPGDAAASGTSGWSSTGASSGGASGAASAGAASDAAGAGSAAAGSSGASGGATDAGLGADVGGQDATKAPGCAGLPLCDDFEADPVGGPPNPLLWGILESTGCSGSSAFSVAVDSTQSHGGSKSVKVVGGDSCGPLMVNSSAFTKLSAGEVYGRFYMRFSTGAPFAHSFFAGIGFQADGGPFGNNQQNYLQMAALVDGTTPVLQWNFVDTELPQRNGMELALNVYPAANAWTCIEFHTSMSQGSVEAWINGAVLPGMTFVPGTTPVTPGNMPWSMKRPVLDVKSVSFGWVDVHAGSNTLWFDDIAIAGSRIGCQ